MKRILTTLVICFTAMSMFAQNAATANASEPIAVGAWSDTSNGLRSRLLVFEHRTGSGPGPRALVAYLELQNTTSAGNAMYVYYDPYKSVSYTLRDSSGKQVSSSGEYYYDGPPPAETGWLALPTDSTLRFRTTGVSMTPTNGERLLIAGVKDSWHLPQSDTTDYQLAGTLTLAFPANGERRPWMWQGTLNLPPVKIPKSGKVDAGNQKSETPESTFRPRNGIVPDEKTAIAIAEAVWIPVFGREDIEGDKPFHGLLENGVWTVRGTLPPNTVGGTAVAKISKEDGRVLNVFHEQ